MKKLKKKREPKNVFGELGFSPEESYVLSLKAQLAAIIVKAVHKQELSQKQLAKLWHVPQPRVSEVMTGKLTVISIDRLVEFLGLLGVEVLVKAKFSPKSIGRKAS